MNTSTRVATVPRLMAEFVQSINEMWTSSDAFTLTAYALWRINHIHPFVNGNGRTARAVCYFVLCLKIGGPLPGPILPELLRGVPEHEQYVQALKAADASGNFSQLTALLNTLAMRQLLLPSTPGTTGRN